MGPGAPRRRAGGEQAASKRACEHATRAGKRAKFAYSGKTLGIMRIRRVLGRGQLGTRIVACSGFLDASLRTILCGRLASVSWMVEAMTAGRWDGP